MVFGDYDMLGFFEAWKESEGDESRGRPVTTRTKGKVWNINDTYTKNFWSEFIKRFTEESGQTKHQLRHWNTATSSRMKNY